MMAAVCTLSWSIEPLSWSSLAAILHLLAEQFAQFVSHQTVVCTNGTGLRAAAAQVATIGKFDEPRHERPIEFDVPVLPSGNQAAVLDVLEVKASHDLGTISRAIEFVPAAGLEDVARFRTSSGILRSAPW